MTGFSVPVFFFLFVLSVKFTECEGTIAGLEMKREYE